MCVTSCSDAVPGGDEPTGPESRYLACWCLWMFDADRSYPLRAVAVPG